MYTDHDRERWAPEPPKRRGRTPFERDRARVLHSAALRRLAAKTQVVELAATGLGEHSPRTRLTHSLECAQIGRELGKGFGCDPDLVEVACLSHDLGHPPFGHNGETALDEVAAGCGGFEGNAQSLRLLTRLEAKSFGPGGSVGLNLTRATLDAGMKYPWFKKGEAPSEWSGRPQGVRGASEKPSPGALQGEAPSEWSAGRSVGIGWLGADTPQGVRGASEKPSPGIPHAPKYGAYREDRPVFEWIRRDAPAGWPCFEAQVMDWSDDVAYSVHDLEDGLHAGHVRLDRLADPAERASVCELTAERYCDAGADELRERFAALLAEPCWPRGYDGTLHSVAALKNLTSELIGRFCRAAERATQAAYGARPLTRYAADLVVPRAQRLECALLKGIAAYYVLGRASHGRAQARERELIARLAAALADGAPDTLAPIFAGWYAAARDDRERLRVIVDQIASLTDTSAVAWHERLTG